MGCGRSIFSKERGASATLQATKKLIKAKKDTKARKILERDRDNPDSSNRKVNEIREK
jgi:hypothetical protein